MTDFCEELTTDECIIEEKINILVLGNSSSGKSTLIKAIAGVKRNIKSEEGDTQQDEISESSVWPFVFIDTKGCECSLFEKMTSIRQVKKYIKSQVSDIEGTGNKGIDVVWYCIEGTSQDEFERNIELMNRVLKGWKNIPVFAVITKSYSDKEKKENSEALSRAFANAKALDLQKIIPVIAKPYETDKVILEPKGISELCEATFDCLEEAKQINFENRERMFLEQKRFSANSLVAVCSASAAVVGAIPISLADAKIINPLETAMTKGIFKIYGTRFSQKTISSIIRSSVITNVIKGILSKLKSIPTIVAKVTTSVLNSFVAGLFVAAFGECMIALSESIYKGIIDPDKVDEINEFVSKKIKESPVIGAAIRYFEKNPEKLKEKPSKELAKEILSSVKQ